MKTSCFDVRVIWSLLVSLHYGSRHVAERSQLGLCVFTAMERSHVYRMRFSDQGYSDLVKEILLLEDVQLLETTALELRCVIEWAHCRLKLFKELARRLCEFLEASSASDEGMSSDEECDTMVCTTTTLAGSSCSVLDLAMNSQHRAAR